MRSRAWLCAALLSPVAACGGNDDTAGGAAAGGGGPSACTTAKWIDAVGDRFPGSTLSLRVAAGDAEVSWSVSPGELSSTSGSAVEWTLPSDAAVHVAEPAQVIAVLTQAGCSDIALTLDVIIDWPPSLRTVVLSNSMIAQSAEVAAHYAAFRNIPEDHLCEVPSADSTLLAGAEYPAWLAQVMACVDALGPHIHYLVPVYGVPYTVDGRISDIYMTTTKVTVSLDALLVYGRESESFGQFKLNPYYQLSDSLNGTYDPFVPFGELRQGDSSEYFLVTRIDGATADAAKELVDRTAAAEMLAARGKLSGTVYADGTDLTPPTTDLVGTQDAAELNIIGVEKIFTAHGVYPVVADYNPEPIGSPPAPLSGPDALYSVSWRESGYADVFTWNPGAIGTDFDSCTACDIRGQENWVAMALRKGITAAFGSVSEPYLGGLPDSDQFFNLLLGGASYGEAAYESTRLGAWAILFVGDPLYRPYAAPSGE